jgi:hypothetical protein
MVFLLADVWRQFKSRTPVMGGAIWADEFLADEGRRRVWKPSAQPVRRPAIQPAWHASLALSKQVE